MNGFEITLSLIGFLIVGHLYFTDIIELIKIGKEMNEKEKEQQHDEHLQQITKHLYS